MDARNGARTLTSSSCESERERFARRIAHGRLRDAQAVAVGVIELRQWQYAGPQPRSGVHGSASRVLGCCVVWEGFTMLKRALAGFAVAVFLPNMAIAAEPSLIRCTAQTYVGLADDGSLTTKGRAYYLREYSEFIVDLSTAVIRFPDTPAVTWNVAQAGNAGNDAVLSPGPVEQPSAIARDFLRIMAWDDDLPIRFFMVRLTSVYSGTCVPII